MSEIYNIYEAKTHLSELMERVAKGEEFIFAKAGKPIGKLSPIQEKSVRAARVPGLGKGKIWYSEDCWTAMSEEELKDWYGDDLPPVTSKKK